MKRRWLFRWVQDGKKHWKTVKDTDYSRFWNSLNQLLIDGRIKFPFAEPVL
jgi:hypothetical protein